MRTAVSLFWPTFFDALLKTTLPEHMVPGAYVWLEALPLTPNGKVDRRALPEPTAAEPGLTGATPRDALEEIVSGLWSTVLHLNGVGIHDNFFELGGHSLLATQLCSRLRDTLAVTVPVRWIFEAPTVAELVDRIRPVLAGEESSELLIPSNRIVPGTWQIRPEQLPLIELTPAEIDRVVGTVEGGVRNVQDIYPLGPLQEGILFHHQLQTEGDAYLGHVLLAFDTSELAQSFITAFQAVVARHDVLRTAVVWDQLREPVQVVWRQASLPVETLEFDPAHGPVAEQLVERLHPRHTRLELSRAPLLHLAACRT